MQGLIGERFIKRFNEILKSYRRRDASSAKGSEDVPYPKEDKLPKDEQPNPEKPQNGEN
jgi:hypothetical protein